MEWSTELQRISKAALKYGIDAAFVAAIRKVENGRPGREFGVLSVKATSYQSQLTICCATVRNNLIRFGANRNPLMKRPGPSKTLRIAYNTAFIEFFASRYAPVNAENDPTGLNKNWLKNIHYWYTQMILEGL